MAKISSLYGVSLAVHGALAIGIIAIREPKHRETIAISVSEAKKKPPEPAKVTETPKPIEQKAEPQRVKARSVPAAKAEAPPPPADAAPRPVSQAMAALPEFGVTLGNGAPGGIAAPQGPAPVATPSSAAIAPAPPPAPKVLTARPADECADPIVKPKPKSIGKPAYTPAAREANIEGRVRVEAQIAADGTVTSVHLLSGLGYGLDEAALDVARHATFEPATRCGKPVATTFVLAMRFSL